MQPSLFNFSDFRLSGYLIEDFEEFSGLVIDDSDQTVWDQVKDSPIVPNLVAVYNNLVADQISNYMETLLPECLQIKRQIEGFDRDYMVISVKNSKTSLCVGNRMNCGIEPSDEISFYDICCECYEKEIITIIKEELDKYNIDKERYLQEFTTDLIPEIEDSILAKSQLMLKENQNDFKDKFHAIIKEETLDFLKECHLENCKRKETQENTSKR